MSPTAAITGSPPDAELTAGIDATTPRARTAPATAARVLRTTSPPCRANGAPTLDSDRGGGQAVEGLGCIDSVDGPRNRTPPDEALRARARAPPGAARPDGGVGLEHQGPDRGGLRGP